MKPRILPLDPETAPEPAHRLLRQTRSALGLVPNLHATLAHAPAALAAYVQAAGALSAGQLPASLREQIAVAVAGANRCGYCAAAHTALGQGQGLDLDELRRNLAAGSADPRVAPVLALARELALGRGVVSEESVKAVRAAGYGDAELVEIAAHVGLNTLTNVFNVFARTTIDFPEVELAEAV